MYQWQQTASVMIFKYFDFHKDTRLGNFQLFLGTFFKSLLGRRPSCDWKHLAMGCGASAVQVTYEAKAPQATAQFHADQQCDETALI